MAVNYDHLREKLEDFDQAETVLAKWVAREALEENAVADARELLRLRRELTDLRDLMFTHAGYLRKDRHTTAADWTENHAQRLAQIMQGDTE